MLRPPLAFLLATTLLKLPTVIANVDATQFSILPGKERTDALYVVRRMQEKYRNKKKNFKVCFVDIERAFDRVWIKVMRKKGLSKVIEER